MDKDLKIAGDLTISDWASTRERLNERPDEELLWSKAFDFFEMRINTRYLKAIQAIEGDAGIEGEGFAITAIICSVIEALETFRTGKTYRKPSKERPLDKEKEYWNESKDIFVSFLKNREPFNRHFLNGDLAADFYENVRCPVLHEAATRNGWKIRVDTTELVVVRDHSVILNRSLFVLGIKQYIQSYKSELLKNHDLKMAFIRKFDAICANG